MSVSFCLPRPVAVSDFIIFRGLCTVMLWMCVLYVRFGYKVRSRTFGCVAMGSTLLCIFSSDVNRVQVVLSGFSIIFFCPGCTPEPVNVRLHGLQSSC